MLLTLTIVSTVLSAIALIKSLAKANKLPEEGKVGAVLGILSHYAIIIVTLWVLYNHT